MLRGLKQALWGRGEPTVVEVGAGLLEIMIEQPSKAREVGSWLQEHHRDRFMIWNLLQVRSRAGRILHFHYFIVMKCFVMTC